MVKGGLKCPKCRERMQRFIHAVTWKPQEGASYYHWWDRCIACGHSQNYPEALSQNIGAEVRHEMPTSYAASSLLDDIRDMGGVIELWHPRDLVMAKRLIRKGVLVDLGDPEEGDIRVGTPT